MQTLMPASHSSVKRAVSEQTQLWTNADKIDDGGVYFIRNANNSNFVWDMPNNNYSDGTAPILYSSTGWGNQRFIVHEQTKYGGKMYYTITPLYSPKSTLKLGSNNENDTLKLGKDNNTSLQGFLSNKFIIEKSNYGYTISTGVSTFGKYIIPSQDNVTFNNTLVQKTISDASDNSIYQWLFCKTDTLGNDLKNKIYLNGTNTQYFNLTPPATGQFVIETERYGSTYLDTYLELYDRSNKRLASNDDIHFLSNNRYSRIIYDFTDLSDVIVRVRGKTAQDQGYVYLTLRPFHSLYFAGVYDFDKNNNDRPGSLENVKLKNYYIEVQGNRGTNAILETAANGKQKINSEYFVFSGHGLGDYAGVEFYNSTARDDLFYNQIPSLNGTKIAIWLSCYGARNYFKFDSSGKLTSMAYQSVTMGADYSLGYAGEIYDTTQRSFPKDFFEEIQNGLTIPDAVSTATERVKKENFWYWSLFGFSHDDFANPILYKKGDTLKTSCGNGKYNDDKSANTLTATEGQFIFVDNTDTAQEDTCVNVLKKVPLLMLKGGIATPHYLFKTNYLGEVLDLGFDCDKRTGHINYYNLTAGSEITSYEFEKLMGEPTDNVRRALPQLSFS